MLSHLSACLRQEIILKEMSHFILYFSLSIWPKVWKSVQFSSVQSLSRVQLFATPWITARQAPCPSPTPGVHADSHPSSQWCHPAISSSVVPFSSFPQSLPTSESFPMSQLFAWSGQSTGVSALASFLPKKPQGCWWSIEIKVNKVWNVMMEGKISKGKYLNDLLGLQYT